LITKALQAGCDIKLGAKALGAKRVNNKKEVEVEFIKDGKTQRVNCKILIGADGIQSNVATWFGLPKPELIVSGYGAEVTGVQLETDMVTILTGQNVAPRFFAWIIPTDSNHGQDTTTSARVGLCIRNAPESAYYYFNKLFTSHPISSKILAKAQPLQTIAGAIPLGSPSKTYCDNVMLVGDAAGQAKPTSGGGIYTSLVCAKYCAETAVNALDKNNCSELTLGKYQKLWNKELGKELRRGLMLHRAFTHLTDSQLEEGLKILNDEKLLKLISQHGDIDYPWKLAKIVFRKVPAMLMFAKPFIKALW
jgi:flavin-dependent dehydrogenase